jgi:hypothetical protein
MQAAWAQRPDVCDGRGPAAACVCCGLTARECLALENLECQVPVCEGCVGARVSPAAAVATSTVRQAIILPSRA